MLWMEDFFRMEIEKILIADDDVDYSSSLAKNLFKTKHVDIVSNADEEINMARQNKYSLIVTDNQMRDGYENSGIYAIEKIREFDKKTPIILNSSEMHFDVALEALVKGANEVVKKSMGLNEYSMIVDKYIYSMEKEVERNK